MKVRRQKGYDNLMQSQNSEMTGTHSRLRLTVGLHPFD